MDTSRPTGRHIPNTLPTSTLGYKSILHSPSGSKNNLPTTKNVVDVRKTEITEGNEVKWSTRRQS